MNKKTLDALTEEMPVIEQIINAYLTRHPDLDSVVVSAVRFTKAEPIEESIKAKIGMNKFSSLFAGEPEHVINSIAETNGILGIRSSGTKGPYKPCKDDHGGIIFKPVNEDC